MTFLTQIRKIRNFLVTLLLVAGFGGSFFISQHVFASTYGSGNYNDCTYGNSCLAGQILLNDFDEFYVDSGKELTLGPNQVVYFDVTTDGQTEHKSIKILAVGSDYVDILITLDSTNLSVRLHVGDTKIYDVNNDGKDDIKITLNNISDGKAVMTFKAVLGASINKPSNTANAAVLPTTKGALPWVGIAISIIFIILAIIIFIVLKRRRKKDDNGSFGPPPSLSPPTPMPPRPVQPTLNQNPTTQPPISEFVSNPPAQPPGPQLPPSPPPEPQTPSSPPPENPRVRWQ